MRTDKKSTPKPFHSSSRRSSSQSVEAGSVGPSFEDFLRDEGRLEESTQQAIKRVIAFELEKAIEERQLTKTALAAELKTSRAQLNRLLDPTNTSVTLDSIIKAAHAVGREVRIELY